MQSMKADGTIDASQLVAGTVRFDQPNLPRSAEIVALQEIANEDFRKAVEAEKARIRAKRSLLDRLFPWVISIRRK